MPSLLLIAIGPVQEFIAQARRTRDLWYGSHLLSEIGKAAARVAAESGRLIFPAADSGSALLEPCDAPLDAAGRVPLTVPNRVLAIVDDPERVAVAARDASVARLRDVAERVRAACSTILAPGIESAWDEQVDTLLEIYACWTSLDRGYEAARADLETAMGSRKALRDFAPWRSQPADVDKSSLDGARPTVLKRAGAEERRKNPWRKLRIGAGEELDAIGLLKRAGGEPQQFVALANVAVSAWVEAAALRCPSALERLAEACCSAGIPSIARRDLRWVAAFPFDAHVFWEERWQVLFEECGLEEADAARWGREHVAPLLDEMGSRPTPYVACLVADGDRMGRTLECLESHEQHWQLSLALSRFAERARHVVEREQTRGVLVYAGGDDVLAFVTLEDAVACADALRRAFAEIVASGLPEGVPPPTLSVGIGVAHVIEDMAFLLGLARAAERLAKDGTPDRPGDRNALAMIADKRSGGTLRWRAAWPDDPAGVLSLDVAALRSGRISSSKVFEVRTAVLAMPEPAAIAEDEHRRWAKVLAAEVTRILARAGDAPLTPAEAGLRLSPGASYSELRVLVLSWVDRVLIARLLVQSAASPEGER